MIHRVTARLRTHAGVLQRRGMASHGHGGHGHYPHGMHFHVDPVHKNAGLAFSVLTWLWIFHRAKEDGAVVLGLEHPWDHGHGHGGHHHHGEGHEFEKEEIGVRPRLVIKED
ncbi:hypothetical protein DYB37_007442 [Aphanomyces astaci]|uniref:Uncharacterized protein n=1 Tax=Aphanomyces astaci TaxID=112090 RepID=A0A397ENL0_APHAT|nr:hypothetical protein AaE_008521 [Aphanomyces astaci]RHX97654.1 hypothetical protein DYB25_012130 [Aphanomyces astaci]RHY06352.1 hypothetical protein DYB36_007612 [Aphanomyces astaci]RHY47527.1 hypothetical protein DYB34_009031 [Aphanomyces astaci]RHY64925.1 hypothetical protein DYB38_007651 [Aphanomyces astaci]